MTSLTTTAQDDGELHITVDDRTPTHDHSDLTSSAVSSQHPTVTTTSPRSDTAEDGATYSPTNANEPTTRSSQEKTAATVVTTAEHQTPASITTPAAEGDITTHEETVHEASTAHTSQTTEIHLTTMRQGATAFMTTQYESMERLKP